MTTDTMTPAQKAWATRKANAASQTKAVREGTATTNGFSPTKKAAGWQGASVCGWCMTGDHKSCKVSTSWYEQTWVCTCTCPKAGK